MRAGSAAGRIRATRPVIGGCALPGPLIADVTGAPCAGADARQVLERLGMSGSSFRPRLADLRPAAVTGYSLTPDGTFVPVPATGPHHARPRPWLFLARACKSWARISEAVLSGIATVGGLGALLAPDAVVTRIFWAVFCLIGLGAVVFLGPCSRPTAFFKGARP
jgi:hypothetical protein